MKLLGLVFLLEEARKRQGTMNPPVVLIVKGVAYEIDDAWWEPTQGDNGAICIGSDPR